MTVSTTLKLTENLRDRIAPLARAEGKSPHAWMVNAIESQLEADERRRAFEDEALAAAVEIDAGGPLFAMDVAHDWIRARAAGRKAARPRPIRRPARDRGVTKRVR